MAKVGVVGGGNWGPAVSKLLAENARGLPGVEDEVVMWTLEEEVGGRRLSEIINSEHENPKYLPGVRLPDNLVARTDTDMGDCAVVVFCLPHQFIARLRDFRYMPGAVGVNLSKGLVADGGALWAPSRYIGDMLGIECSTLMGANIATEVAQGVLSDTTIGYASEAHVDLLRGLFTGRYFRPALVPYAPALEICGAVKNVMSIAYGVGCGRGYGKNTLAMLFRRCLLEMRDFCEELGGSPCDDVLSSACLGDLFASCLGGRNFKYGRELGAAGATVEEFEASMGGQKLQGPGTAQTVVAWLDGRGSRRAFPIIRCVHRMCCQEEPCDALLDVLRN